MKAALQLAAVFALLSVGAAACCFCFVERDAARLVRHADASLVRVETWGENESQTLHSVLLSAKKGADIAADFSQQQVQQLQKTSRDTDNLVRNSQVVLRNAEQLLYHSDQELNTQLLPHLDQEIRDTSTAAQFSFESITHASDALTFQLNDPAIGETVDGLNLAANSFATAAQNFAQMTAKGDDTMAHVDHTFAYYDKKLTTPLGFWKTLGKTLLATGSQSANIYSGFFRPYPQVTAPKP